MVDRMVGAMMYQIQEYRPQTVTWEAVHTTRDLAEARTVKATVSGRVRLVGVTVLEDSD